MKSRMSKNIEAPVQRLGVEMFSPDGDPFFMGRSLGMVNARGEAIPFMLDGILIALCRGGAGAVEIDGKRHELSRGSVVILPENHILRYADVSPEMDRLLLFISTDYILDMPSPIDTNIFLYSMFCPVIQVDEERLRDYESYYRFIDKERVENGRNRTHIIKALIYALMLELSAEYEERCHLGCDAPIHDESVTDRFFRQLAADFREQRSVCYYAGKLHLTPKYLSEVVRRNTGRTALDWIHETVMIEARMLLKATDLTVQEISDRLNFSSASAFVQFFRKHEDTTPGSVRKEQVH